MEFTRIKEELYQTVLNQLKELAKYEQVRDVYAIAFDLGEFDYVLRYQTLYDYEDTKVEYAKDFGDEKEFLSDESLAGFKYAVGDFKFVGQIAQEKLGASNYLKDFFDSMAYYVCDYIDDITRLVPRDELPDNLYHFLLEACLYCADRLKTELDFLQSTNDFIIFVTEHDISDERKFELISKTVDSDLFKKLKLG